MMLVGLGFLARSVDPAAAQTWQTVADFGFNLPASVDALAKDAAGNLYAAINTSIDPQRRTHAQIRKSSNRGKTWKLIDDLASPIGGHVQIVNLGADASDRLYAAGYVEDGKGNSHWMVRRSTDGGSSWATVDDSTLEGNHTGMAEGLAADAVGNVYVAGYADTAPCPGELHQRRHWLVRQSCDGGQTWATIDDFCYGYSAKAEAVLSTDQGLFVAGSGWNGQSTSGERWLVRKGTSDGAGGFKWQTVDEFQLEELGQGYSSVPHSLGQDGEGNLYAAGRSCARTGDQASFHWIVRKASSGGTDWTLVDKFQLDPGCYSVARGVTVITPYDVYVIGHSLHSKSGSHWIVRHSATGNPGSWRVDEDFKLLPQRILLTLLSLDLEVSDGTFTPPPLGGYARGCAILATSDAVFAAGLVDAEVVHAIVRKRDRELGSRLPTEIVP